LRIRSGAGRNVPRGLSGTDFIGLYGKGHIFGAFWTSIDMMDAVSGSSSIGVHIPESLRVSACTFHFPLWDVGRFKSNGAGLRLGASDR
jgi:hypothetical protein